jgi:electron transfer flavoprotein beta subunit
VCSVEAAGVRLRRAPLRAAFDAAKGAVPVAVPAAPGSPAVQHDGGRPYRPRPRVVPAPAGNAPRARLLELTGALTVHEPPTLVGPVGAGEAADALLDFLRRHGYLTEPPGMTGQD